MKFNIKKYLGILSVTFLMFSCTDYFELQRPPQFPWNTLSEFEGAAIGTYATLFNGEEWNNPYANIAVVKVSSGDDVDWVKNSEWGYWRKTKQFNKYTREGFFLIYRAIAGANDAIDFIERNNGNPFPQASEADIQNNLRRLEGELHFIRGYAYYLLQTTFGHAYVPGGDNTSLDLPLRTQLSKSVEDAKKPKMGTTQEIYDLILSDFKKAKDLLPTSYVSGAMHSSYQVRANKFAASAMLARTYFLMGDYTKSLEELNFVIDQNGGKYDLSEDPIEAFNKSSLANGKEVIFYIPFYPDEIENPMHITVLNHNAGSWGQCTWVETRMGVSTVKRLGWMNDPINDTTLNLSAKADKRFQQLYKVRYPKDLAKPGQAVDTRTEVNKITTIWPNKYFRGPKDFATNVPLIRLGELYLTRSILKFKAGDKAGAAADLNKVKQRAWDENIGGPFVPVTAANITEQMIHDERLIEMFGENDRIDYLRGLKVDISKGERAAGSDPYTSESFVWAIPDAEKLYNESLKELD